MNRPHFHFITLFPETIHPWLNASIIGRAREKGVFDYTVHQLRDYTEDKHRTVDDVAYGGGGGMVLKVEPLVKAVEAIRSRIEPAAATVICFTPAGQRMTQERIEAFLTPVRHFILVCGHYEGIDQRFIDHWADAEISLGDFVLTGGELPALAFCDSLLRQIGGTLPEAATAQNESFKLTHESGQKLIEYPHFTRPSDYRGLAVPPVLLSGDHQAVDQWRRQQSWERTHRLHRESDSPL